MGVEYLGNPRVAEGGSKCVVGIGGVLRGVEVGMGLVGAGHCEGVGDRSTYYKSVYLSLLYVAPT